LRDRWLEHVNADASALPEAAGKYDLCRALDAPMKREMPLLPTIAA
jgi:hypothetical protein